MADDDDDARREGAEPEERGNGAGLRVSAAEAAVQTDAGVNLDEEMTNLLQYQRSYQAAARVVPTIDDILDTLINHTGIG